MNSFLPVWFLQRTVLKRGLLSQKRSSEDVSSTKECTTYLKQDGMFFSGLLSGWRGSTTGLVDFPQGVRRSSLATLPDRAKTSAPSLILALRRRSGRGLHSQPAHTQRQTQERGTERTCEGKGWDRGAEVARTTGDEQKEIALFLWTWLCNTVRTTFGTRDITLQQHNYTWLHAS